MDILKLKKKQSEEAHCLAVLDAKARKQKNIEGGDHADHIMTYIDEWNIDGFLYIQMELCQGLTESGKMQCLRSEAGERKILLCHILKALEFIHRNGWCHLDIKLDSKCMCAFVVLTYFEGTHGLISFLSEQTFSSTLTTQSTSLLTLEMRK